MNRKNTADTQTLTQVVEFAKRNVSSFPGESAAAETIATLDSQVRQLSEKASARLSAETAMRENRTARITSRNKLRGCLDRAGSISSALGADKVRTPVNGTEDALIASAHAFIDDVGALANDFARHGVGPEDVGAAVEALEAAIRRYGNAKAERSAAINGSRKVLGEAKATLVRFDVLVGSYLADDREAMAAYAIARSTRRLKARRSAAKESGDIPAPPVSPIPAPAP